MLPLAADQRKFVTAQQVCAIAASTVRILRPEGKNPIGEADPDWIFACNCEGADQLRKTIEEDRRNRNGRNDNGYYW